ncbi:hypothetical protein K435DRAFT_555564, partial [Dendrothele bispora CBS 962.96]
TFGQSTIWKFNNNASAMKSKLAARDFEDLLQCSIPVFDGLMPTTSENNIILDLLWDECAWHALAKLLLHTETTLHIFDKTTVSLGNSLQQFSRQVAGRYYTTELPQKEAARGQRHAALVKKAIKKIGGKAKPFNLDTCKLHSLGDYAAAIHMFGTTDNYTTQIVS